MKVALWSPEKILENQEMRNEIQNLVRKAADLEIPKYNLAQAVKEVYKECVSEKVEFELNEEENNFYIKAGNFIKRHRNNLKIAYIECVKTYYYNLDMKEFDIKEGELLENFKKIFTSYFLVFNRKKSIYGVVIEKYCKKLEVNDIFLSSYYMGKRFFDGVIKELLNRIFMSDEKFFGIYEIEFFYKENFKKFPSKNINALALIWAIQNEK